MATALWAVSLVLLATVIGALGPIYLKKASKEFAIFSLLTNRFFLIGVLFYGLGTVLFIPALKGGDLSILYPLVALMYVWVSLLSIKLLNEQMNAVKWIGVALIILGVSLIGLGAGIS